MQVGDVMDELFTRQEDYREQMKANERIFLEAIVASVKLDLFSKKATLQFALSQEAQAMKQYASTTLTQQIAEGLRGKTGTKAVETLQGMKQPELTAPIK